MRSEARAYQYDPIGNRTQSLDQDGATSITYATNELNEYSAVGATSPIYDEDGNLLNDGIRTLAYNAENQLKSVTIAGVSMATYEYDYLGRRVRKSVAMLDASGGNYATTSVCFGWNKIEERKSVGAQTAPTCFVWGLDVSQSRDGAGGIGGLIVAVDGTGDGVAQLFAYDGNGNVSQSLAAIDGSVVARYEYDAFGNAVPASAMYGENRSYKFSTKEQDDNSGMYYYGYRYLIADLGRWSSRDPLGEVGGMNVYGFVDNNTPDRIDILGLQGCMTQGCADAQVMALQGNAFNSAIEIGNIPPGFPRELLGRYIYGDGSTLYLSPEVFLENVKPRGSIYRPNAWSSGFSEDLKADVKRHCSACRSTAEVWRGRYRFGVFDRGSRTAGLGYFLMEADVSCSCMAPNKWEVQCQATTRGDYWDFNWTLEALALDLAMNGVAFDASDEKGRERRTFLGSALPGKPFWIKVTGPVNVMERFEDVYRDPRDADFGAKFWP